DRACLPAPATVAQAFRRAFAAGTGRDRGAGALPVLRIGAALQAGRGRHRDAGGDPPPLEGDPDGAGEVFLPGLRDDHSAAGALPCDAPGLRRPQAAGDDPVREVRTAPATEPTKRALPARGDRPERLDAR